jgi:hypothetical protein
MKNRDYLSHMAVIFALSAVLIVSGCATTDTASRGAAIGGIGGALLGAGLGAAIGAIAGNPGLGAAIGASAGALTGTTAGYAVGQNEKIMRAQGRYPPPIPSYVSSVGSPQWNGNFWILYDPNGNIIWWNENEERWQY